VSGITWLHISDLHFRESQVFDTSVVVRALLLDLSERVKFAPDSSKIDLIFVTGDLAFSGKRREYALVHKFLDELRRITHVKKSRIFVIPGNHDVDRSLISDEARGILSQLTTRNSVTQLLGDTAQRAILLDRLKGYKGFVNNYFGRLASFDNQQYFYVKKRRIAGKQVAIWGLNSALSAGSDSDRLNLFLGEHQLRNAMELAKQADIHIGLVHHPFDWLQDFDRSTCEALLLQHCHFILRGHLHETKFIHEQAPGTEAIVVASGACYESRDYPNSYNLVHINLETMEANIYLRSYSDKDGGFWTLDSTTYRNVQGSYPFSVAFITKNNQLQRPLGKEESAKELISATEISTIDLKIVDRLQDPFADWWVKRGYESDPFVFENAEDMHSNQLLEKFQWWYVDPEMPAESKGLGIPHFLNKVKSIRTSDPVSMYIPKGGGKTFYRKWASRQINTYDSSGISVEISDLAEDLLDREKVTTLNLIKYIQRKVYEKLNLKSFKTGNTHSEISVSLLNNVVKNFLSSSKDKEIERVFLFIDGVEKLFDENKHEQNHRAIQALAEMCKAFADQNEKMLALRLFMPGEVEKKFREILGNKYVLQIHHYSIRWDLSHCESIIEARLDSYWQKGPNSLLGGHLERLLSQDAITELRRGLHGIQVSPRCMIRLFKDLTDYAYTRGVTWDQLIDSKTMMDFMKNDTNKICSAVNYPFVYQETD
jgi:predicted MPP superfamily phosphohydrolase